MEISDPAVSRLVPAAVPAGDQSRMPGTRRPIYCSDDRATLRPIHSYLPQNGAQKRGFSSYLG